MLFLELNRRSYMLVIIYHNLFSIPLKIQLPRRSVRATRQTVQVKLTRHTIFNALHPVTAMNVIETLVLLLSIRAKSCPELETN
ncbi:hypothetical protein GE21DRAFT_1006530 [Neurospora crassa]|nr:hypothetical protein GE21DRAFT_1006530 [Neurospora crassa]